MRQSVLTLEGKFFSGRVFPVKRFAITNLKEIDFMNNTWTASLIEVFNSSVEVNEPTDNDVHTFDYYYE